LFIIIALILVGTNIPLVNRESNLLPLPADMRLYCNMRHSTSLKCTIKIWGPEESWDYRVLDRRCV